MTESEKPDTPQGSPETPPTQPPPQQGPQQYPPPPQYPYQPYQPGAYPGGYPPPPPRPYPGFAAPPSGPRNGLGIAALVIAIIALVFVWSVFGGIIGGIVAVIIGFVGYGRAKRGEATNGGVAIAGIVLGFVAIIASLIFIPIWIAIFNAIGVTDYTECLVRAGSDQEAVQRCADQFQEHIENQFSITVTPTR
jgi:hypothetical protein